MAGILSLIQVALQAFVAWVSYENANKGLTLINKRNDYDDQIYHLGNLATPDSELQLERVKLRRDEVDKLIRALPASDVPHPAGDKV